MPVSSRSTDRTFPVIDGPSLPPPVDSAGDIDMMTAWTGEDIAASLELLQVLMRQPWGAQVAGIDASTYSSDKTLTIQTTFGTRVVWGGRVTRPNVGEVSTASKLKHIEQLYAQHKRIDAGFAMIYVNNNKLQFDISATAQAMLEARQQAARRAQQGESEVAAKDR